MKKTAYLTILFSVLLIGVIGQNPVQPYKVLKTIKLGGNNSGWDYLTFDKPTNRLFLSNDNCVQIVDLIKEKVIGQVKNLKGVHGIAIVTEYGKGYISEGATDSVVVFDLKSFKIVKKIKSMGRDPDAILYDTWTKKVFVFNANGFSAITIDPSIDEVTSMLMLPGNPEFAVSDGFGKVYVNLESVNNIAKIDAKTLKIIGMYALGSEKGPTGLAYDHNNKLLFAGCRGSNQLMVADINSGDLVDSVNIGTRCDGVYFLPDSKEILTSNGEGTITVIKQIDPWHYKALQTLITKHGARTITYDDKAQRFYLPVAEWNDLKHSYIPNSFGVMVIGK